MTTIANQTTGLITATEGNIDSWTLPEAGIDWRITLEGLHHEMERFNQNQPTVAFSIPIFYSGADGKIGLKWKPVELSLYQSIQEYAKALCSDRALPYGCRIQTSTKAVFSMYVDKPYSLEDSELTGAALLPTESTELDENGVPFAAKALKTANILYMNILDDLTAEMDYYEKKVPYKQRAKSTRLLIENHEPPESISQEEYATAILIRMAADAMAYDFMIKVVKSRTRDEDDITRNSSVLSDSQWINMALGFMNKAYAKFRNEADIDVD